MNTLFNETLAPNFDADALGTTGQTFGHDAYANGAFDHNSVAETYQTNHCSPESHWNSTSVHSALDTWQSNPLDNSHSPMHDGYAHSQHAPENNSHSSMHDGYAHSQHTPENHWNSTSVHSALDTGQSNPLDSSHSSMHDGYAHSQYASFHSAAEANPYTTIDNNGHIYKHVGNDPTGNWIATVHDGKVYNFHNDYLGYAGTDGKVYDEHDQMIGWVDNQGHVFNSAGHQVCDTTQGVVGGAAYLLTIYHGNVP